jgi:TPR repeat protein
MLADFDCLRSKAAHTLLLFAVHLVSQSYALAASVSPDIPQIEVRAEDGGVSKQLALGEAYLTGHGAPHDLKQAAYWYEKAAGQGDPMAQNQIGYFYQVGLGVPADPVRAVHWYQLAASNGLTRAKVNLAVAYLWGSGVQKDPVTAERLLHEAAKKGDDTALTYLGDMYFLGIGVPKDEAAGEKWYGKAIKSHNYLASYRMGMILSDPLRGSKDLRRALSLLRASASAGFVAAMHAAGLLLVNHPEICISHAEALTLLNEAAGAGMWKSSLVLGALAREGKWVPQDPRQAYFHFSVGTLQGGEAARALVKSDLQVLSAKISPQERAELDERAKAWADEHNQPLAMLYKDHKGKTRLAALALATPQSGTHAGNLVTTSLFD